MPPSRRARGGRIPPLAMGEHQPKDRPAPEITSGMLKDPVKDRVTAMVRDVLGPEMKAAGFRRSGRTFWRDGPDVCHVVSVKMNRWGSRQHSTVGVALGVFWHRVEAILENPSTGKVPPPEHRCTFRIDLGRVVAMPPKLEWRVTRGSNLHAIGSDVRRDLRRYILRGSNTEAT